MVKEGQQIILQESDCHQESLGLQNLLLEDVMDSDCKYLEQKRAESSKMLRSEDQEDEDEDEEDDPEYMLILQNLKEHDKSYRIEYEEDGSRAVIKYEGDSGSDAECDQEPREKPRKLKEGRSNQMPRANTRHCTLSREMKMLTLRQTRSQSKSELDEKEKLLAKNKVPPYRRKLRSATKQTDEHLNRVPDADSRPTPTREIGKLTRTNPRSKSRSEKEEDVMELDSVCHTSRRPKRLSTKSKSEYDEDIIQVDSEYHLFFRDFKTFNGNYASVVEGTEIVYEIASGSGTKMKENDDGESSSDLEIIESTAFDKKNKGRKSNHGDATGQSEFRQKVIAALRKPFDKKEYKQLRQLIEVHKPKERHMDLRGGRERPVETQEYGKSYLDHHPDLKKLLLEQDNLPKCLNLLRGFFLWIEHSGEFCPWLDDECLAVRPRSHYDDDYTWWG